MQISRKKWTVNPYVSAVTLTFENGGPNVPKKKAEAKLDGVINQQNYNFNEFGSITISDNFNTENFDALKTLRVNRSQP